MKAPNAYVSPEQRLELARLRKASADLIRRAEQDKEVALQFLRDIGYYVVMRDVLETNTAAEPTSASAGSKTKRSSSRSRKGSPPRR